MEYQGGDPHDAPMADRRPERVSRIAARSVAEVCALAALASCSADVAGLDPSQLESRLSPPPSTEWMGVSTSSVTGIEDPARQEVIEAFDELMVRRVQCGRDPARCDVSTLAVAASPIAVQLEKAMSSRAADGITASDRGRIEYRVEDVEFADPDRALLTVCVHDDTVLVSESSVFDDSVYSARSEWTLVHDGGSWLWSNERVIEWITEGNLCEPA